MAFYVLAVGEMLVPAWAERGSGGTPWHPGHIAERYGLFTLIVLGECIAAATVAIHAASSAARRVGRADGRGRRGGAARLLVLVVVLREPLQEGLRVSGPVAFMWGYGHYFVFASVAALGTGLELAAAATTGGTATAAATTAGLAVAVPVAVYLVVTGALQGRLGGEPTGRLGWWPSCPSWCSSSAASRARSGSVGRRSSWASWSSPSWCATSSGGSGRPRPKPDRTPRARAGRPGARRT